MTSRKHLLEPILSSYKESGGINHLDRANLPSKKAIEALCNELLHLLFPGFFSEEAVSTEELPAAAQEIIDQIAHELEEAIAVSLRIKERAENDTKSLRSEAIAITERFFAGIPQVRALLKTDVEAAYAGDPAARSLEEIVLAYPGLEAVAIQRVAHLLYKESVPLLPRMMTEWAHSRTGIDIHPGASIGSHFFIDHGTGVVIGETCVIGNRVKLYHGVTLGARSFQKDEHGEIIKGTRRHPHVEDDVVIYPNGIILGGDTVIGARSTIGANVFLMKSIPPDTLLVRAEQVQTRLDKKGKKTSVMTVQLSEDEIDFMI
ncbi:MAG: serine acetyltransferase [Verrucomicrobia bacterium]|jgi:serine O-acetyltransferase|nr:MAG: serine acetyltransferase [Verrucomicrobiota bacterium]